MKVSYIFLNMYIFCRDFRLRIVDSFAFCLRKKKKLKMVTDFTLSLRTKEAILLSYYAVNQYSKYNNKNKIKNDVDNEDTTYPLAKRYWIYQQGQTGPSGANGEFPDRQSISGRETMQLPRSQRAHVLRVPVLSSPRPPLALTLTRYIHVRVLLSYLKIGKTGLATFT